MITETSSLSNSAQHVMKGPIETLMREIETGVMKTPKFEYDDESKVIVPSEFWDNRDSDAWIKVKNFESN